MVTATNKILAARNGEAHFLGASYNTISLASKMFQTFADSFGLNAGKERRIW